MITRRAFFALFAALPFVGKMIPQKVDGWPRFYPNAKPFDVRHWYPTPTPVPFATLPSNITDMITVDDRLCVMCSNGRAYVVFEDGSYEEIQRPQRHQA